MSPRIHWRATAPDGVAHAFTNVPHALCGVPNQPERFDYLMRSRCPTCRELEEVREKRKAS